MAEKIAKATRKIGWRDPDDVELLALAMAPEIPVWSKDNDFKDVGVEWYTTARLLKKLGAGIPPRRRKGRQENAKDFSLVAAMTRGAYPLNPRKSVSDDE